MNRYAAYGARLDSAVVLAGPPAPTGAESHAGAVAFAGPSGIGKSTLVECFLQRGHWRLGDVYDAVQADLAPAA